MSECGVLERMTKVRGKSTDNGEKPVEPAYWDTYYTIRMRVKTRDTRGSFRARARPRPGPRRCFIHETVKLTGKPTSKRERRNINTIDKINFLSFSDIKIRKKRNRKIDMKKRKYDEREIDE